MTSNDFFRHIRQLIAEDQLADALEKMRLFAEKTPLLNDVLQQSGRLAQIRRQNNLGVVSHDEATLQLNRIRYGMLELLNDLKPEDARPQALGELLTAVEQESARPEVQAEVAQAIINIVNSKNTLVNSQVTGQNVHIGDIVYQTAAPAAAPAPKREYNRTLTRALVEAMRSYNDKAEKLCQDFTWLDHAENRRKVQQFVFQNFVGEIGKQLRKLVNIGDDELMAPTQKQRHYVDKCLDIARRSFELLNYTLLSVWWDAVKTAPQSPVPAEQEILSNFFNSELEQRLHAQFRLLQTLCSLFRRHDTDFPFGNALERLLPQLTEGSELQSACARLEQAVQAADTADSETQLAGIMRHFAFLTQYRMVSLKKISYRQLRNGHPEYLHRYVALGIDVKYSEDAEKGRWVTLGEQTPAVLLYRGDDYQNGINLFPFVVDYNALTFEQGAKICFYSARDLGNHTDALEYRFLGDNSIVRIEKQGVQTPQAKLDELMMNPELLKALNLDCVVDGFHEARNAMSGRPDDFFDNL